MHSAPLAAAADAVFQKSAKAMRGELLQVQRGEMEISDVVTRAHRLADELTQEIVAIGPATERPTCCAGCAACCHLHVVATAPEVIALAEHVQKTFDPSARQRLDERIADHIEATRDRDGAERRGLRTACPLLENDRCTAYAVRPIACRGWNSLDRSACDADLANPSAGITAPLNLGQFVLAGRVTEGIRAACYARGLEHRLLDLSRGLKIALADLAGTVGNWLGSGQVFETAVNDLVFPAASEPAEDRERSRLWGSVDQNMGRPNGTTG
jgi:hypothetical protein